MLRTWRCMMHGGAIFASNCEISNHNFANLICQQISGVCLQSVHPCAPTHCGCTIRAPCSRSLRGQRVCWSSGPWLAGDGQPWPGGQQQLAVVMLRSIIFCLRPSHLFFLLVSWPS